MDARYPPEALAFGTEVRNWIRDNLPKTTDRDAFMAEWTSRLFDGGFVCASWPKEYGGRGLSAVEQVVLNEEFARWNILRRHRVGEIADLRLAWKDRGHAIGAAYEDTVVIGGLAQLRRRIDGRRAAKKRKPARSKQLDGPTHHLSPSRAQNGLRPCRTLARKRPPNGGQDFTF